MKVYSEKLKGMRIPAGYLINNRKKCKTNFQFCNNSCCGDLYKLFSTQGLAECENCLFDKANKNLFKIWFENMYKGVVR